MSWAKLLSENRVTAMPPSKEELDNLRSIVKRSLNDVNAPGLSTDAQFLIAYDAARTLALIVVRAAGYRPRSIAGHYNTFLARKRLIQVLRRPRHTLRGVGLNATLVNTTSLAVSAIPKLMPYSTR